jgi:hypothetical protein
MHLARLAPTADADGLSGLVRGGQEAVRKGVIQAIAQPPGRLGKVFEICLCSSQVVHSLVEGTEVLSHLDLAKEEDYVDGQRETDKQSQWPLEDR